MAFNPEGAPDKIVFTNQPKLSEHEADRGANERRRMLVPEIERFLSADELFAGKDVKVEFSHGGVSSLLSFVETGEERYVLKIPLNPHSEGEADFLNEWESVGVRVPHVFREGRIADHPYILMQRIDAQTLEHEIGEGSAPEDSFLSMGKILALMHTAKAEGYGRIVQGRPEYERFEDWVRGRFENKLRKAHERHLLGDEHGNIDRAIDILISYVEEQEGSSYCHGDFSTDNLLATEPMTVIDPSPSYNDGIIDLGLTLVRDAGRGRSGDEIVRGYFEGKEDHDAAVLQASVILASCGLLPYWHERDRTKKIRNVQRYLMERAHLLR